MTTLESYLTDGIHRDRADIATIETVLRETASTIIATFNGTHWPYEVTRGAAPADKGVSQSTTAMMIRAVDLLLGDTRSNLAERGYSFDLERETRAKLLEIKAAARKTLLEKISPKGNAVRTSSRTYGWDDPLTLSFLVEIFPPTSEKSAPIETFLSKEAKRYLAVDPIQGAKSFFYFGKDVEVGGETAAGGPASTPDPKSSETEAALSDVEFDVSTPLVNAFIPLRVVRTSSAMKLAPAMNHRPYLRYFESTLHDQLSFVSIPDSRFDPAELAFCLEGMLLSSRPSVDPALFGRVLDVLRKAQESSAHWRPTKPFLRNERGMVLFPLSVETANALVRSCQLLDTDRRFDRFTEEVIRLLRRFWEWLSARRINFPAENGLDLFGWHSEHVADIDSIQLWDTAQVVEFLLGYRRRLHLHVARTTLQLARFDVRAPNKPKWPWSDSTREFQKLNIKTAGANGQMPASAPGQTDQSKTEKGQNSAELATIVAKFEPVTTLGPRFRTYHQIGVDFVEGWLSGTPQNYSMLLYGPPGTGKTSVAENIADALGFPLISITVSDFLAEGGGAVEARAKMIFDVLEAQSGCVVLFDEIDELLLDRSSARHGEQDTVFKFMTPGMLTKLNNLRRKKRIIFVLATNYAYRIDPAIRRTGRIDQSYLLLPPDLAARKEMLRGFLETIEKGQPLHPDSIGDTQLDELSKAALFLGYKDIEASVARVLKGSEKTVSELEKVLKGWARTTSLEFYRSAFSEVEDTRPVRSEFLPLVQMQTQEDVEADVPLNLLNHSKKIAFTDIDQTKTAAAHFVEEGEYIDEGGKA